MLIKTQKFVDQLNSDQKKLEPNTKIQAQDFIKYIKIYRSRLVKRMLALFVIPLFFLPATYYEISKIHAWGTITMLSFCFSLPVEIYIGIILFTFFILGFLSNDIKNRIDIN